MPTYTLDSRAAARLARSHGVLARVYASVQGSTFTVPLALQPGGRVEVDAGSATRRKLSCEVVAHVDSPTVDALTAELRAEYAVVDELSGEAWWVPVGTFVVTEAQQSSDNTVSVTGEDRWRRVVEARFEQPVTTQGNTVDAITQLLLDADPRITVDTSRAPSGSHSSALWERDRDDAITKLAQSIGASVYFDPMGVAVIERVPTLLDASVWAIGGGVGGVRVSSRRGTSRSKTYNAAVVRGEPEGRAPVYAVARVESGPLRWGGPFGRRPRFLTSSLIETPEQAQQAAEALLARVQGVARTLSMETLPNPALDAGHVVSVQADTGWQRHVVETFSLPLGLGTTPIATRSDAEVEGE